MENRRSRCPASRSRCYGREGPTNICGILWKPRAPTACATSCKRYCRGEQDGVSILISGTRGMGKTTMAKLVVQRLITEDIGLIPLPLILHGPTLLRPDAEADPPRRAPELATPEEKSLIQELNQIRLKKWVLRGLIAALYQHVATHIVEAWENAISRAERRSWWSRDCRRPAELQQLKAHLALKLD